MQTDCSEGGWDRLCGRTDERSKSEDVLRMTMWVVRKQVGLGNEAARVGRFNQKLTCAPEKV